MKYKGSIFLLILLLGVFACSAVYAQGPDIAVFLDDIEVAFPDQRPVIDENSRTLVPIRFIVQEMRGYVTWDDGRIQIQKPGIDISIFVGESRAVVNGREVTLDTCPVVINERTMVPLRFISERLGAEVNWDGKRRRVYINTRFAPDKSLLPEPRKREHVKDVKMEIQGNSVTLEIKFQDNVRFNEEWLNPKNWYIAAEINGQMGALGFDYYDGIEIYGDREKNAVKISNLKLPSPTRSRQVVSYHAYLKGPFVAQSDYVYIEPDPKAEIISVESITVIKKNETHEDIILKFSGNPGHFVTSQTVTMIRKINNFRDTLFNHTNYRTDWDGSNLTLKFSNVDRPRPTEEKQEVVYIVWYRDMPPVMSRPYTVPAK